MESERENISTHLIKQYNGAYIQEKYDLVKCSDLKYALIQANIKNFRYYNTKYGSASGNEILNLVFQLLSGVLTEDEYAGYLYSDNFIFLLRYEDIDVLVYKRMMDIIDRMYRIKDDRIYRNIFFSYGIYKIADSEVSFFDALNYANLCRKACPTLQNRSSCMEIYEASFRDNYMDRMELENRTAEAYKNYEFVTYLQPKIDLETEQVVSAEALLRWFDQDGNSVPLYQFMPILNQNGYIQLVDLDIFESICQCLQRRIKSGQKVVPVSFNISKSYFYDPNILQDYIHVFEKYDIPKELIEIEFMESISLDDTEQMKKIICGFKDYGFSCSLDDFGNGYSSFNVLLNASFDYIKMDRQFFLNNLNGDNKLIIKTIIELIHSLKMQVVAEGVELKEHVDYLKQCGCDYVQGYYYYKPMSIDSFEALLDEKPQ